MNIEELSEHIKQALDNVPSHVYIKDTNRKYIYANKKTLALFGCSLAELKGQGDEVFFTEEAVKDLESVDRYVLSGNESNREFVFEHSDGTTHAYIEAKTPLYADADNTQVIGILGISTDISSQKNIEIEIRRQSNQDPLTQIANRRFLFEQLNTSIARGQRNHYYSAVIYLDLDNFKPVNDTYGHRVGDRVLVEAARRLEGCTRDFDTTSRVGGDEFVLLLDNVGYTLEEAVDYSEQVRQRVMAAIAQTFSIEDKTINITCSSGMKVFRDENLSATDLLAIADREMYANKAKQSEG